MAARSGPVEPLSSSEIAARLRALSQDVLGSEGVDDLEMRHLLEILTRTSLLTRQGYDTGVLDAILSSERPSAALLDPLYRAGGDPLAARLTHLLNVPDGLRTCGDRCLYDVGLAGRTRYKGIDLNDLGPRSYSLASEVLALLAEDRELRSYFDLNLLERLPIDEEILFLRQCAARFRRYARILRAFREPGPGGAQGLEALGGEDRAIALATPGGTAPVPPAPALARGAPEGRVAPPAAPAGQDPRDDLKGMDRDERLSRYESDLLLSSLDVAGLRGRMKEQVVDQDEAVDQLCDDLTVFALGTRDRPRPQSYLLVGPTGVGKNHLVETLVRLLEEIWSVEVPVLLLEGPQYTYPSDVGELKGSTRGFIRSDEEGLLAEFHARSRRAPLSFLVVDEVEKAHPQLIRFFLSLMDRGTTMDNRGRLLRFPATVVAYTSNLGYSEEQMLGQPIGYGAQPLRPARRGPASRNLKRGLPPEFLNRLKVLHFAPLTRDSAARILDQELQRIAGIYRARHGVEMTVTGAARRAILDAGFNAEYGARHLVGQADRVCNVEVGLRLRRRPAALSDGGRRLLARIREARGGGRAIDETALRAEVARESRALPAGASIVVDWEGDRFLYRVTRG